MTSDIPNAAFELCGSLFVVWGCRRLYIDKQVRGSSWLMVGFFCAWGWWNTFYYLDLEQPWSWYACILLAVASTARMALMIHYLRREGKGEVWKRI